MSDLVAFLWDRLDEDEHDATWEPSDEWDEEAVAEWAGKPVGNLAVRHAARWSPARVLAEVEAKRRIIDWALRYQEEDFAPWNEDLLRLLVQPYADHPDFDPAWRD